LFFILLNKIPKIINFASGNNDRWFVYLSDIQQKDNTIAHYHPTMKVWQQPAQTLQVSA